jgi:phthiocerol/phenolphthiocerol synthesis type-I polyketide synthase D
LVWLKSGDRDAPLFGFTGAGGTVDGLSPLAERLTDARAIAGLDMAALARWTSVDDIAEQALALVVEAQPKGPYHLLGYSFGGLIALEVARRLREADNQIALLILVEATYDRSFWPLRVWAASQVRRTLHHLSNLQGAPLDTAAAEVSRRARRLVLRATARLAGVRAVQTKFESGVESKADWLEAACMAAMGRFRPRPYAGRAIFFKAVGEQVLGCDLTDLWRDLIGHLEVEGIPSDHLGIVQTPEAVIHLAERVDAWLAAAETMRRS